MAKKRRTQQEVVIPLKDLRETAGLTQQQMAYELGVALSTYRRWEQTGNPALTYSQWVKFCTLVGRDFSDLSQPVAV